MVLNLYFYNEDEKYTVDNKTRVECLTAKLIMFVISVKLKFAISMIKIIHTVQIFLQVFWIMDCTIHG